MKCFMISFRFEGKTYLAMVSKADNDGRAVRVKLYSDDLRKIIPGGELSVSDQDYGMLSSFKHPKAKLLVQSVRESVEEHLKLVDY